VIHRDLTSGNIMVRRDGSIRVMDFGIAASLKDAQSRATGSEVAVSIHYASPEQINGEKPSASMDIYSLGCVFYEMLVGQPPFRQGDVIHQQLTRQPDPMLSVSPLLNQAVLACLAKDPRKRPGSAEEVRAALDGRRIPGHAPLADHTIKIARPPATARRTWIGMIWGAVAALILVAVVLLVNSGGPTRPPNRVSSPPEPTLAPAVETENPSPAVETSPAPGPDPTSQPATDLAKRQAAQQRAEELARQQATEKAQQEAEDRRTRAREYVTRGDLQFANSDWQSAMKAYETALTIDSSNSDARQGLARAQKNWRAECSALNTCK
jgi:serine/threonine protein kinase